MRPPHAHAPQRARYARAARDCATAARPPQCRFVVVGPGAILEAVGGFESLRKDDAKGLATVSNDDNSFECHIRLAEVAAAQFATKDSPAGRKMHIVRLLSAERKPLLSAILHPEDDGKVEEGAIQFWESLRQRFGDEPELTQAA